MTPEAEGLDLKFEAATLSSKPHNHSILQIESSVQHPKLPNPKTQTRNPEP